MNEKQNPGGNRGNDTTEHNSKLPQRQLSCKLHKPDYEALPGPELKRLAIEKAKAWNRPRTKINQKGNRERWLAWLQDDIWSEEWEAAWAQEESAAVEISSVLRPEPAPSEPAAASEPARSFAVKNIGEHVDLDAAAQVACRNLGLVWQPNPADGCFHRLTVEGKQRSDGGTIKLFSDGEGGIVWNWVTGEKQCFWSRHDNNLSAQELAERKIRQQQEIEKAAREREERQRQAAAKATAIYDAGQPAVLVGHEYLTRKQVTASGTMRVIPLDKLVKLLGYSPKAKDEPLQGDILLLPVGDQDGTSSLEMIDSTGRKSALAGSQRAGKFWATGELPDTVTVGTVVMIGEGAATVLSAVAAIPGSIGIAAFGCTNLKPVALAIREHYPAATLIVLSDLGNGERDAAAASKAAGATLAVPVIIGAGTDFNDLHQSAGLEEIARQLADAKGAEAVFVTNPMIAQNPDAETQPSGPRFDLSRLLTGADIVAGDYEVSFLVDRLIPESSITLFYAKGGSGKSTLATQIAASVKTGIPFLGLTTLQRPVIVVDFENPRAVLKKRIQTVEGADQVHYWIGSDLPQLNTAEWVELKSLVVALCNPLVIIDTLSSSCSSLDIANNKDLAPVMARIIELRNMGATIVLLHHTPKSDETKYIGASCIYNQCDHILAMYPVRQAGSDQEATDDDEQKVYRLGTKDKSRFDHFHLYVEFDDCSGTFTKAADPAQEFIDALTRFITEQPGITQTEILSKIGPKNKIRSLLKNNDGVAWRSEKGLKNATHYYPISVCQFSVPLRAEKQENRNQLAGTEGKTEKEASNQSPANTEFACFSAMSGQTGQLDDLPDFDMEVLQ